MSSKRITKLCTNLHPAPSTTTQFISTSTQLSATPSIIFEPKCCTNWVISPNLGWKTKCPFWLKIGTLDIVEVMILNPELDFWNFDPKIKFWTNLDPNIQSCLFCLKIGTHGISRMLILIATLVLWISNFFFWFFFGKFGLKKSTLSILPENWHTCYLEDVDSYSKISFLNFKT